jgi:DNA-binding transcriptional ArsR family regulator
MVVSYLSPEAANGIFHALSDATRRDILRRCGQGEASVSQLAETYPMSFAAVQKHVAVLQRAGLVDKERRGREQIVHANGERLAGARRALDDLEAAWRRRVERMAGLLAEESEQSEQGKGTER